MVGGHARDQWWKPLDVEWPGVDSGDSRDPDEPWARITVSHIDSAQTTLGGLNNRRFTRQGIVAVQMFSPLVDGGGLTFAEQSAIISRDAFEGVGTASGIWFRNTRIKEIGPDATWYQINVIAEFQYDELK